MLNIIRIGILTGLFLSSLLLSSASYAVDGERKTITGEVMDTWCYVSQIMGGSDFVVGTTHHVCAVWCAAGGVPVGLLDKSDGTIYMIMGFGEDPSNVANAQILDIQSHEVTVEGTIYNLDGINYIMVENVVEDKGITNFTHEIIGILPAEANP